MDALAIHCLVYSLVFSFWGPTFVVATFCLHFLTDAVTSRITSYLWFINLKDADVILEATSERSWGVFDSVKVEPWKRHWFFVVIGLDQLIHYATLALTLRFLA